MWRSTCCSVQGVRGARSSGRVERRPLRAGLARPMLVGMAGRVAFVTRTLLAALLMSSGACSAGAPAAPMPRSAAEAPTSSGTAPALAPSCTTAIGATAPQGSPIPSAAPGRSTQPDHPSSLIERLSKRWIGGRDRSPFTATVASSSRFPVTTCSIREAPRSHLAPDGGWTASRRRCPPRSAGTSSSAGIPTRSETPPKAPHSHCAVPRPSATTSQARASLPI